MKALLSLIRTRIRCSSLPRIIYPSFTLFILVRQSVDILSVVDSNGPGIQLL